jgi:hypothetical protein
LLATAASTCLALLAGCTGDEDSVGAGDGDTPTDRDDTPAESDDGSTGSDGETPATSPDEPDLREANVTGVSVDSTDDGYRFGVTLFHDDDGEDGYANWWQVETLDGERLGRRDLAHPHGTQEFTRSTTVDVPDDVECVVVRGHDGTHAYGGQAALVALPDGETRSVRQGPGPETFRPDDCP